MVEEEQRKREETEITDIERTIRRLNRETNAKKREIEFERSREWSYDKDDEDKPKKKSKSKKKDENKK